MNLRFLGIALVSSFFLFSCSMDEVREKTSKLTTELAMKVAPEVTPKQKKVIQKKANRIKFKKQQRLSKSKMNRVKLRKGQWVTTLSKMKSGNKDVTLTTTKVIAISRKSITLETETYTASDDAVRTISQITFKNLNASPKLSYSKAEHDRVAKNVKIIRMLTKSGDDPVQVVPKKYLVAMQGSAASSNYSSVRVGGITKAKCSTTYIKSSRCIQYKIDASIIGVSVGGTVFAHAKIPISGIVKIDGDGQMDPKLLKRFVLPILKGQADYTKGNRFYNLDNIDRMPGIRLFGNAVLSFMTKLSTGYWDTFDPTNGYTAIHSKIAEQLPFDKISSRYFFESDILFRLNTLRAVVFDIPMETLYGDEKSNLKITKILNDFL